MTLHRMYSWATVWGSGYKQQRKMSWTEKRPWLQSAGMNPASFLFSLVLPALGFQYSLFTVLFWKCSSQLTYLNTIASHCFLHCMCPLSSFQVDAYVGVFMTTLKCTNTGVSASRTSYPWPALGPNTGLSFWKRLLFVLQSSKRLKGKLY